MRSGRSLGGQLVEELEVVAEAVAGDAVVVMVLSAAGGGGGRGALVSALVPSRSRAAAIVGGGGAVLLLLARLLGAAVPDASAPLGVGGLHLVSSAVGGCIGRRRRRMGQQGEGEGRWKGWQRRILRQTSLVVAIGDREGLGVGVGGPLGG